MPIAVSRESADPVKQKLSPPSWPVLEALPEAGAHGDEGSSYWPSLPTDAASVGTARGRWSAALEQREQERRQRLDLEQRGIPWNA
jgi:hypothetical protein